MRYLPYLVAILIFGVLVLIHELGHFLLAKLGGIGVVEFSLGMGPRLCSVVWGETRYSIKILPFGGSCMMLGEDSSEKSEKAFHSKPVWTRIAVIAAGPVFNLILAFFCAMAIIAMNGRDVPVLDGVIDGFPAAEAGLMAGDKITKVNNQRISANRDLTLFLLSHPGETFQLTYERPLADGTAQQKQVRITPQYSEENKAYMLGVRFSGYQKAESLPVLLGASLHEVTFYIRYTFASLRMIASGVIPVADSIAGPPRIVNEIGKDFDESIKSGGAVGGMFSVFSWGLLLSTSLGLMNLFPIPALDGGRLVFLVLELLRGKPVDQEKEGMVHAIGMLLLMALMVLVLFNDIKGMVMGIGR